MDNKTIIIHIPANCDNIRIVRKIETDENDDIRVEIIDSAAVTDGCDDDKIFCCFQDKSKQIFSPSDYAFIESTSNHYSVWHPIEITTPELTIYTKSLSKVVEKLVNAGLRNFWRVHESYIVNCRCIASYNNDKIILKGYTKPIPIGRNYKSDFYSRIVTM